MNDTFGRVRKEAVMAYFKVLFQHLKGQTEENYNKPVRIAGLWAEF
jgi:hypothetical protein